MDGEGWRERGRAGTREGGRHADVRVLTRLHSAKSERESSYRGPGHPQQSFPRNVLHPVLSYMPATTTCYLSTALRRRTHRVPTRNLCTDISH